MANKNFPIVLGIVIGGGIAYDAIQLKRSGKPGPIYRAAKKLFGSKKDAEEVAEEVVDKVEDFEEVAEEVVDKVEDTIDDISDVAEDVVDEIEDIIEDISDTVSEQGRLPEGTFDDSEGGDE